MTTASIVAAVAVVLVVAALIVVGQSKKNDKATASAKTTTTSTPSKGTTKPTTKATVVTWTHQDLQGTVVVVSRGTTGSARFVVLKNGTVVPAAVEAIDDAFANKGCAGAEALYNTWKAASTAASGSENSHARSSAYAEYALEKGKASQCSWAT